SGGGVWPRSSGGEETAGAMYSLPTGPGTTVDWAAAPPMVSNKSPKAMIGAIQFLYDSMAHPPNSGVCFSEIMGANRVPVGAAIARYGNEVWSRPGRQHDSLQPSEDFDQEDHIKRLGQVQVRGHFVRAAILHGGARPVHADQEWPLDCILISITLCHFPAVRPGRGQVQNDYVRLIGFLSFNGHQVGRWRDLYLMTMHAQH